MKNKELLKEYIEKFEDMQKSIIRRHAEKYGDGFIEDALEGSPTWEEYAEINNIYKICGFEDEDDDE